ncbi:MAG: hypothetical protein K9M75_03780 [Phycisphaerae bacterium]|nr:hypothetical protein [Phycisphaerae bacterium]
MRKGATIIEMIGIMAILLLVAAIIVRPMRNVTRTIPQQYRDYQSNSVISGMLDDLRKDVEASSGLMQYKGNTAAAADMLVIDSPGGVISYSFAEGKVTRSCDLTEGMTPSDAHIVWDIPGSAFDWKLREHQGKPVAVEISTGINRRTQSGVKTNLKNSHVIFAGINTLQEQL